MNAADAKKLTEETKQAYQTQEDQKKHGQQLEDGAWVNENFSTYLERAHKAIKEAAGHGSDKALLFVVSGYLGESLNRLPLMSRKVAQKLREDGYSVKEETIDLYENFPPQTYLVAYWG